MVLANVILFLSIVNFLLTFFIFLNAKEEKQHISFLIFSLVVSLWLFDNFLTRISSAYWDLTRLSYGLGIFVATFALVWVYNLVEEKLPFFILFFIFPVSTLVFFISSFTNYVTSSSLGTENLGYTGKIGFLFIEYTLYLFYLISFSLYKLLVKLLHEKKGLKKQQIFSVFVGATIFGFLALVVNFLVPLIFNTFGVSDLVTVSFSPLLFFIVYSTVKHQLFGIKIIMTQFLVAIFLALLLLNFLLSSSFNFYIWNGILLAVSAFLGYLIIKNLFREENLNRKLLEEAQESLDFEKRLRNVYTEIAKKGVKTIDEK